MFSVYPKAIICQPVTNCVSVIDHVRSLAGSHLSEPGVASLCDLIVLVSLKRPLSEGYDQCRAHNDQSEMEQKHGY
jgi:hypothetical protein